ncbi:MAG: tryptophan--tRNA ligase [Actinomycetota bacterium]|nr:tryptophan--tRNA ligase [Actinomycetota bacterium]
MERKTVFSGIQPTGEIHIGNYLGAWRNIPRLQDHHDVIACVVDLHALTVPRDPARLHEDRLTTAKTLLAVGIDPHRSLLYYQSQVPQHVELSWILGTLTQLGVLNRMTQFKEKANRAGANLGLYAYPVLMAADILVQRAHLVPVGEDQTQHLELSRDLAERFNSRFGDEFPVPEALIPEVGARIMSLKDPTSKMEKSDPDADSRILITDPPHHIARKLRTAVTDSGHEVRYDREEKAGIANLLEILSLFTERPIEDLEEEYHDAPYAKFKEVVAEAVIDGLSPVRASYRELDDDEVARLMDKGALDARSQAERLMASVRSKVGLGPPPPGLASLVFPPPQAGEGRER